MEYKYSFFFSNKSSLKPIRLYSCTRIGWFRLSPIDQYSSLLPPVGVWSVLSTSVGDYPLKTPKHKRLGKPLPYQQSNVTHAHLLPINLCIKTDACHNKHRVLIQISLGYAPVKGRLHTRYSPVRRSSASRKTCYPSTCMC